jgi:hypothetical protein
MRLESAMADFGRRPAIHTPGSGYGFRLSFSEQRRLGREGLVELEMTSTRAAAARKRLPMLRYFRFGRLAAVVCTWSSPPQMPRRST